MATISSPSRGTISAGPLKTTAKTVKPGKLPKIKPFPGTKVVTSSFGRSAAKRAASTKTKPGATGGSGHHGGTGTGSSNASQTSAPPVTPFLTPDQQLALDKWNTNYGTELTKLDNADTGALTTMTNGIGSDELKNAEDTDATNQSMGARGLFQSSIRATALNDLAATLTQQENLLRTNYHATLIDDQTARDNLNTTNSVEQNYYSGLAVQNAQSIPPNTQPSPTPTTGASNNGNQGHAGAAPSQGTHNNAPRNGVRNVPSNQDIAFARAGQDIVKQLDARGANIKPVGVAKAAYNIANGGKGPMSPMGRAASMRIGPPGLNVGRGVRA